MKEQEYWTPPNKKVYSHLQLHKGMRVDERDWKLQTESATAYVSTTYKHLLTNKIMNLP